MKTFLPIATMLFLLPAVSAQQAEILKHPGRIVVTRLDSLNSPFRETNLTITPDGRYLFFQSQRGGMSWSQVFGTYKGQPRYDGDLWFSRRSGDTWQKAVPLAFGINTASGEDEPNVSADGQSIIYQSWKNGWEYSGGPYYQAELHGEDWQKPIGLGGGINRYFAEEQPKYGGYATDGVAVSVDGRIFLVACGPDYDKPMDVYVSQKTGGQWSYLRKAAISTGRDERSLFIAGDNRTLFFASDGYGGSGGLDIFKTTLNEDGSFGQIYNIGEPFNTSRDDYGFIITASGEEAYFVRDGDIYYANLRDADPRIRPLPTLIVSGTVKDPSGRPMEAKVQIVDRPSGAVLAQGRSNALTGEYSLALPKKPGDYEIAFLADRMQELRHPLDIQKPGAYEEITTAVQLLPEAPPPPAEEEIHAPPLPEAPAFMPFIVQFDFDKWTIKPEFAARLDELAAFLKNNPGKSVRINGHTDSKGGDGYNVALGEKRARSVERYLREKGVANAIRFDTRGEKEPVDDNSTPAGAYRNRRAEIRVE